MRNLQAGEGTGSAPISHEAAARPSRGASTDLLLSGAGHTALMVVGILGVILGGAVYVIEMRKSRHC
jgi:hypothetical protein